MAENAERNLRLYRELITCGHSLYFWTYDMNLSCLYTNSPSVQIMGLLFQMEAGQLKSLKAESDFLPVVLSADLGFTWIVDLEKDSNGIPLYYHVIGPAFISDVSLHDIEAAIARKLNLSVSLRMEVSQTLADIPILPLTRLLEYGLMLHFCITGQKLSISDFVYSSASPSQHHNKPEEPSPSSYGTWAMEQKLMRLVEEGNLDYQNQAGKLTVRVDPAADLGKGNSLRHLKNMVIAFISSCTRAAIRGGLSPDIAYAISDKYILSVESCNSVSELAEVNDSMLGDFIRRVHQSKHSSCSSQIRQCCQYIQLHIEEKINFPALCDYIGYSESWLSRKFKKEMGMTVSEYITLQKIERAKELLISGNDHIQDIAGQLGFRSQSYFGDIFRKHTGMSPGEYREQKR